MCFAKLTAFEVQSETFVDPARIDYWRYIDAPKFILDIIKDGYSIPFRKVTSFCTLETHHGFFRNSFSALDNCHSSVKFTMEIENDGMLPFPGIQLLNKCTQIQTKIYVKPTNTGLLLHYKTHVDHRYKRGLLKTMLDRDFRLSSNWSYFSEECERLKMVFSRPDYPDNLVNSTITHFIADNAPDQPTSRLPATTNEQDLVRLVLRSKTRLLLISYEHNSKI